MNNELFSVIMLHYNQPHYVLGALRSVMVQKYENIEFIFADDASKDIDLDAIKSYVEENKGDNIKSVRYVVNEKNQGTVKTINRAIQAAQGSHILFFAADDALYDENVISNFVSAFEKAAPDVYMISSQCHMMDKRMEKELYRFVSPSAGTLFNESTALAQYKIFCEECFLAIGATAMRKDMFGTFGAFNEEYKFVEDWSYFLHLTRNGGRIQYENFSGLYHRDGGISHTVGGRKLPPHVLEYKYDIMRIFEKEILPFAKQFDPETCSFVLARYQDEKQSYKKCGGTKKGMSRTVLFKLYPSFYLQNLVFPLTKDWTWMCRMARGAACLSLICAGNFLLWEKSQITFLSDMLLVLGYLFGAFFMIAVFGVVGIFCIKAGLSVLKRCKKLFGGRNRKNG